jgi:hypothetical protein
MLEPERRSDAPDRTDGTVSHWKYILDNVIVYLDVYSE